MTELFRIYLDDKAEAFCLVDEVDYQWALRWRWIAHPNKHGRKFYASRSTRLHGAGGPQTRIYMHKAILERTGLLPPSPLHVLGDHEDGNSLNNRRDNLRWATTGMNRANIRGSFAMQKQLGLVP